jgi:hypothetical protein
VIQWAAAQSWCDGDVATWGGGVLAGNTLFHDSARPSRLLLMTVG